MVPGAAAMTLRTVLFLIPIQRFTNCETCEEVVHPFDALFPFRSAPSASHISDVMRRHQLSESTARPLIAQPFTATCRCQRIPLVFCTFQNQASQAAGIWIQHHVADVRDQSHQQGMRLAHFTIAMQWGMMGKR